MNSVRVIIAMIATTVNSQVDYDYIFKNGLFCHSYGYDGNAYPYSSLEQAKDACDSKNDCAAVIQWTCGSSAFGLCGTADYGLGNYGTERCLWEKSSVSGASWNSNTHKRTVGLAGGSNCLSQAVPIWSEDDCASLASYDAYPYSWTNTRGGCYHATSNQAICQTFEIKSGGTACYPFHNQNQCFGWTNLLHNNEGCVWDWEYNICTLYVGQPWLGCPDGPISASGCYCEGEIRNSGSCELNGSVFNSGACVMSASSCCNNCGQSAGGCWCDSLCHHYGDCCSDKVEHCGVSGR